MEKALWDTIETIVDKALTLKGKARETYITEQCENNAVLKGHVVQFLNEIQEAEDSFFLEEKSENYRLIAANRRQKLQEYESGTQIGPYQIVHIIESGGMGSVYKAKRADGAFEMDVAIKFIKTQHYSDETLKRFELERKILAKLQHPNIARMLDGGVTDNGVPYIILEYIDGIPINQYCCKQNCSMNERLSLFKQVLQAVRYAHENLVIHRDLKPGNIFVDDSGMVKILDFGISKLLEDNDEANNIHTQTGTRLLTTRYAAPEQIRQENITTATDLYALGVVFYELLAGASPYDLENKKTTRFQIEQAILYQEASKPSQKTDIETDKKKLKGDLDAIALKAIRKEPDQRHRVANEFLEDLNSYQNGLPVSARDKSVTYQVLKFTGRHKTAVAVFTVFILLSVFSFTFYTLKITQERDRAEQVTQFLIKIFRESDPMQASNDSVTIRQVLDAGAVQVNTELVDQPKIQAKMQSVIGQVYYQLGLYEQAEVLLESALQKQEKFSGARAELDMAHSIQALAQLNWETENYNEAELFGTRAFSLYEKHTGETSFQTQASLLLIIKVLHLQQNFEKSSSLMELWMNRFESLPYEKNISFADHLVKASYYESNNQNFGKAVQMLRTALRIKKDILGDDHAQVAVLLNKLSSELTNIGNYEEAIEIRKEAVQINRNEITDKLSDNLYSMAVLLTFRGEYEEADSLFRESIQLSIKFTGENSAGTLSTKLYHAKMLLERKKTIEAVALLEDICNARKEHFGAKYFATIKCLEHKAHALKDNGMLAEAEILYDKVLNEYDNQLGESHYMTSTVRLGYGHLLILQEKPVVAEKWIRDAIDLLAQQEYSYQNKNTMEAKGLLGLALKEQRRFIEAEKLLLESYESLNKHRGPKSNITKSVLVHLISLYDAWEKPLQAEELGSYLTQVERTQ